MMTEEIYELIGLTITVPYEIDVPEGVSKVCEDDYTPKETSTPDYVYDADGVPMGRSREEIKKLTVGYQTSKDEKVQYSITVSQK